MTRFLLLSLALVVAGCATAPIPPIPAPVSTSPQLPSSPARADGASRSAVDAELIALAESLLARAPRAQAQLSTEGRLPGDPIQQRAHLARQDWYGMLALALAYQRTGEPRYGEGLERYLSAWTAVYVPEGNPINESAFDQVVLAYRFGRAALTPATDAATRSLFEKMTAALLDSRRVRAGTRQNNWQSHRVKIFTAIAFTTGNAEHIGVARVAFHKQLAVNIGGDGVVADFRERDALHYAVYSLEPLLTAALFAKAAGEDWYSVNGAPLARALDWLAPYARGEQRHEEFRNTRVPLDRQRAAAGVPGFSGDWLPVEALATYRIAARVDARWQPIAESLGPDPAVLAVAFPY